jgi:hypothetical protein
LECDWLGGAGWRAGIELLAAGMESNNAELVDTICCDDNTWDTYQKRGLKEIISQKCVRLQRLFTDIFNIIALHVINKMKITN